MNFIFDLDGTLVDSSADIVFCLNQLVLKFDLKTKIQLDRSVVGPPLSEMINNIVELDKESDLDLYIQYFRQCYSNLKHNNTKLMKNANEVLVELVKNCHQLYILTNKPQNFTNELVLKFEIKHCFKKIISLDENNKEESKTTILRKLLVCENMNKEDTYYIGDTEGDMRSALEVGIKGVFYSSGYGKLLDKELAKKCNAFIFDLIELIKIV